MTRPSITLCSSMTRILLPGQVFFFAGGVLASVALVRKQFTYQALAPLVYTCGIILGGVLFSHRLGIRSLAWGAFFGALLGPVCVNGYAALRAGARVRPTWDLTNPGLREWIRMSLPLMFGFTVVFMDTYILTFFSRHFAGDISRVLYAKRLFSAPIAVLGQAAGAASMPFFASLFSQNRLADFAAAVNRSITRILAVSLLAAAALFALAQPLIDLLLRGGAFSRGDARATAALFAIFTISLPFWAAQSLYARAFFAAGDTRTPMLGGTAVMPAVDSALLAATPSSRCRWSRMGFRPGHSCPDSHAGPARASPPSRSTLWSSRSDLPELARALAAALLSWGGIALLLHALPRMSAVGASHGAALLTLLAGGAVWLVLALGALKLTGSRIPDQILRRRAS